MTSGDGHPNPQTFYIVATIVARLVVSIVGRVSWTAGQGYAKIRSVLVIAAGRLEQDIGRGKLAGAAPQQWGFAALAPPAVDYRLASLTFSGFGLCISIISHRIM